MKLTISFLLVWFLFHPVIAADTTEIRSAANPSENGIQTSIDHYLISLRHHNNGVVQSAITNLIHIRMQYPGLDYCNFSPVLGTLEESGKTEDIRFLAGICKKCLERSGLQEFLSTLTEQQTRRLLGLLIQSNSLAGY